MKVLMKILMKVLILAIAPVFGYHEHVKERNYTALGLLSILFWSTSVALVRGVAEHMGTLNMAFFNLLCSALFLFILLLAIYKKELFRKMSRLRPAYYYRVGAFLIVYMVLIYMAVGNANSREAVIVTGIINYLWPGLAFLFSIPILKERARYYLLVPGILLAFSGTAAAILKGHGLSAADIGAAFSGNLAPYLFAFIAAVSWALYSNMTKKYRTEEDVTALPVLFLAAALVVLVIQLLKGETPHLHLSGWQYAEFAYFFIFPTALAYLFWDKAMKQGNKNLVTAVSYAIPLASTLISGYYLDVTIDAGFGLAALLVIAGAVLCRRSIIENPPA
jgi:drug/metabolite transporter (DMT)-like permease